MNDEKQSIAIETEQYDEEDGFNLIGLLIVLAKHKRKIIGLPVVAIIVAIAISFALPVSYKASTKMLPPQQAQSSAAALLAQLGGVAGAAAGAAGVKNPNDLFIGMLKSRRIADRLIERFDLKKAYGTTSMEVARKRLEGNTVISSGRDNLIVIEVEDGDKQRVAQIANAYAEELLKLTKVIALTEASQRRMFFERQLEASKNNLANAEITLKAAIEKNGVISVDSDSRAIVEMVSHLRAQIAAKEIQLSSMRAFVTANNQEYRRAQEELSSLRSEFARLQNGSMDKVGQGGTESSKQAGLENMKIVREVKYHQMLYELLSKQYEVARLDESKDASIIQVLDSAIEPERRSKPQRTFLVLIFAALSLFIAIGWALLAEFQQKAMRTPEQTAEWDELKSHLRWRR